VITEELMPDTENVSTIRTEKNEVQSTTNSQFYPREINKQTINTGGERPKFFSGANSRKILR